MKSIRILSSLVSKAAYLIIITIAFLFVGSISAEASENNVYSGKELTLIVPYSAGGGFDRVSRLFSRTMEQYLHAKSIKVVNKPGGGGLIGANEIYTAKPDGLTFGVIAGAGSLYAQLTNVSGVKFDMEKFQYIGSPDLDPFVLLAHSDGPYQTFGNLIRGEKSIQAFAAGKSATEYIAENGLLNLFKVKHNMVLAFDGSNQMVSSFLSGLGDVFSITASVGSRLDGVKPILQFSNVRIKQLPDVPSLLDVINQSSLDKSDKNVGEALAQMLMLGRLFVTAPGVSEAQLTALRQAFKKSISDKKLIEDAQKQRVYLHYTSGTDLVDSIAKASKFSADIIGLTDQ